MELYETSKWAEGQTLRLPGQTQGGSERGWAKGKTVAIIQARLGSTRLPGKVLRPLAGRPMLEHVIRRLQHVAEINRLIVATTTDPEDDVIDQLCARLDVTDFRGSRDDVLSRYYQAARAAEADTIVRITGDCPLIDPAVTSEVIRWHLRSGNDFTANDVEESYPRGTDVEVISMAALKTAFDEAIDPEEREHVTLFFYRHRERFSFSLLSSPPELHRPSLRLCVDEPADLTLVERIFAHFAPREDFSLAEVICFLDQQPHLRAINAGVQQKAVWQG